DLRDLGGASSADVNFSYREKGTSTWTNTSDQTLNSAGTFSETVSGLTTDQTYEFRANADNGTAFDNGSIKTFTPSDVNVTTD
ncbi:MAG: serine protease, partial [Halobacteria archaeon]|nr:serine protease [Halobacteria archaeon]